MLLGSRKTSQPEYSRWKRLKSQVAIRERERKRERESRGKEIRLSDYVP
jgi:hypothetical protein